MVVRGPSDAEPSSTAGGFMTVFSDMVVKMDQVTNDGSDAMFRWTWRAHEALASVRINTPATTLTQCFNDCRTG